MDTTRRDALGLAGMTAAAAALTAVGGRNARAATPKLGSREKTLFWAATITPCDKSGRFDPGAFKDVLAWFKHNGADGVVVLGTSGEFPHFSVAERKLVTETALKNKQGLNVIVGPNNAGKTAVVDALRVLHSKSIMHRDCKASNLLLNGRDYKQLMSREGKDGTVFARMITESAAGLGGWNGIGRAFAARAEVKCPAGSGAPRRQLEYSVWYSDRVTSFG